MKTTLISTLSAIVVLSACAILFPGKLHSADEVSTERFEYVTLRWGGRENTHLVRPSGNVEFLGSQFSKLKRPERADDRSFYMNIALNALAKEGYELASMTSDDYVMKRRLRN